MATKTVSILQAGTNSHTESSENVGAIATDFISQGVVGAITNTSGVAPTTGGYAANAQGTPNMTVAITAGVAWVTGTPTAGNSQTFRVKMTSSENVTIAANSTGGTRYDYIYIKLDAAKLANPNLAADDVATLVVSRSTSNTVDDGTPPTYGYLIAKVTVTNGASSIANANIADSRTRTGTNYVPSTSTVDIRSIANPYKFLAYKNAAQGSPNSSPFKVTLDAEIYDTNNNFDSTTNNRYTVPVTGYYFIYGSVDVVVAANTAMNTYIYKNGSVLMGTQTNAGNAVLTSSGYLGQLVSLTAGDYLELYVQVAAAAYTLQVGAAPPWTYMGGYLVSTT